MDNVQNWYEKIVFEKIAQLQTDQANSNEPSYDPALWADVVCLALNHLPPRYVRHSVDMTFYLSPQEQHEMDQRVDESVRNAMAYVRAHPAPEADDLK